ncbi:carbohydrate kinase family protein [Clostridium boliviensis]|uniref:Carbohydrate kinase family protein n=1 Tax=Clostridium boliviensis TaxID=318465 RepID=A0ABU4GPG5_9CLOT|nr:carbohydrate kinase family protein [Clostridium boliviensis]MDW2799478.1 carbohydrate kinase family protein [Clostridium boliviensis]
MPDEKGNKKIIVAGHISLDITPVFKGGDGKKILRSFQPGKLLEVGKASVSGGGAAFNTGLGLHALGAEVLLMANTGDDDFGRILKGKIQERGCESCITVLPGEITSYTIVLAPKGVDRLFLHNPGCNDTFGFEHVDLKKAATADHFHFGYPTLMKRFYQNDGLELKELFCSIKELGLTTSLDLAAVDPESEAAACRWDRIFKSVLPYVDFFVPSIEELGFLLNRPLYEKWQAIAAGEDITSILSLKGDVETIADQALQLGAKAVLLKCGAAGMFLKTASNQAFVNGPDFLKGWGEISYFQNSFLPDRILSATGAGDTSIAAFIKAMLERRSPVECVRLAAATGASCVTAYDTVSGLMSFEKLEEKMKNGWEEQKQILP